MSRIRRVLCLTALAVTASTLFAQCKVPANKQWIAPSLDAKQQETVNCLVQLNMLPDGELARSRRRYPTWRISNARRSFLARREGSLESQQAGSLVSPAHHHPKDSRRLRPHRRTTSALSSSRQPTARCPRSSTSTAAASRSAKTSNRFRSSITQNLASRSSSP